MTKQVDMGMQLFGFVRDTLTQFKNIVTHEEKDDRLCCPDCGSSEWTIREYSKIQCNTCYAKFKNLGAYGMERLSPVPKHRPFKVFGRSLN